MTVAWEWWPQWTILASMAITCVAALQLNGEPRTGEYNGAVIILCQVIFFAILWAGGFWS